MQQRLVKGISILLITIILYANAATVVSYAADNFLSDNEIENQTVAKEDDVEFDVYYDDGKHSASIDMENENTKLNIAINVNKSGYLKDVVVDFSNANFKIEQTKESENIQAFDEENKKVTFNQINNGVKVTEGINIKPHKENSVDQDNFSKDNEIKFSAIYVNAKAKEIKVERSIIVHTEWKVNEAEANVEYEITKYIPYATNGVNKLITQGKVTSYVKNSVLPIKETKIEITAQKLNNEYPEEVTVVANTTNATNGDLRGEKFTTDNWSYDKKTGKITINVKNDSVDGKINWQKNTMDQYIVTYIYSKEVYEAIKNTPVKLTYLTELNINLYGNGKTELTGKAEGEQEQTEKLGEVIEFTVDTTKELSKGYMYNNKNAEKEDRKETEYTTKYTANVSYADIIDEIIIEQGDDKFVTSTDTEMATSISGKNYTYNKTLKMSKQEIDKVFGEDGKIEILNDEGIILETVNKETIGENGTIAINLSKFNESNISIKTSKPQKEGNVTFEVTKAIVKDINYSVNQIKNFESLKTTITGNAKNEKTDIVNTQKIDYIKFVEPTQKVGVSTNNNRLSTVVTNENIELKVTLENDSADDIMYANPTIKLDLPNNIENLNVKTAQLFFDDELSIREVKVMDNDDGTKSIVAKLEGLQTKYNSRAVQGATIVFTSDITLNKLTPTTNTSIKATAINGNAEETLASNATDIKYVAPTGVVTTNSMTGYNGDEKIEVINGESKEVTISAKAEQKELTFTMNVINNYENSLDNIVILGRTPFAGNKDVVTAKDLGSNMNLPLSSGITVNGIEDSNFTVYYSKNEEATQDLENSSNAWATNITDFSRIRSYMIVLKDYTMNTGDTFSFTYNALVPANAGYNKAAYETYSVFFNNNQTSGTIKDKASATKIGLNTGSIATVETTIKANNGESIKSGEELKYTVTVKNTGTLSAENTTISVYIPAGLTYEPEEGEQYQIKTILPKDESMDEILNMDLDSIEEENRAEAEEMIRQCKEQIEELKKQGIEYDTTGTIKETQRILIIQIGEITSYTTFSKDLTFSTDEFSQKEKEEAVEIKAIINYSEDGVAETNTVTSKIEKFYFECEIDSLTNETVIAGSTYEYIIMINSSDYISTLDEEYINRPNTILTITLPNEFEYDSVEAYEGEALQEEDIKVQGNTITVKLGDIKRETKVLRVKLKAMDLEKGVYAKSVTIKSTVKADNTEEENLPDVTETINKAGIKVTQSCDIPEEVTISSMEDFNYTFTIENLSEIILGNVKFTDTLPNEVQFNGIEIIYSDGTVRNSIDNGENNTIEVDLRLNSREKVTINVKVIAKSLNKDTTISNKAEIEQELAGKTESNTISHVIKLFNKDIIYDDPDDEDDGKLTKKIIGTIWIDENKDGIKDADEQRVPNIKILLLDNKTGNIAIDSEGNECIVQSGSNGTYMFNNIKQGEYSVIFLYNSSSYSPTVYRKAGVSDNQNSDAMDKTIMYEGKTQVAAVTEEVVLSTGNVYNIDLGLIEDAKFDLKLDKQVKTITVNNAKETSVHEYNGKLAKIDFVDKYVTSSSMVVEYKFIITNEGGIPGYVKKLADYLPAELKFNSELNKDWYEGKNGVIYNASLANTIINPGESKELTLVLTKTMNSEDFGLINNSAEIYEASNDYGVLDVDSLPGNKASNEDDYSTANVLTTIKTGQVAIYTALTLTVIAIIATGVYVIKKKVL